MTVIEPLNVLTLRSAVGLTAKESSRVSLGPSSIRSALPSRPWHANPEKNQQKAE